MRVLIISFKEYFTKIRLNHAIYEMRNSNKLLIDISMECGFANNKFFINAFKGKYGMTPLKYKKEIIEKNT